MLSKYLSGATLAVSDMERARRFYENDLGFEQIATPAPDSILYKTGTGGLLVYKSEFAGTNKATAVMFGVPTAEFRDVLAALREKGIRFDTFDTSGLEDMSWDDDGVLVGGGMLAVWFKDPDGNIINISTLPEDLNM